MIIKENITVYQCEFCKKKLFVKHAMENHIRWCTYNPENYRVCNNCKHLEKTTVEYEWEGYDDGNDSYANETRESDAFKCNKLDIMVYPFTVEKRKLPTKFPETFKNQEPMKKDCEFFIDSYL